MSSDDADQPADAPDVTANQPRPGAADERAARPTPTADEPNSDGAEDAARPRPRPVRELIAAEPRTVEPLEAPDEAEPSEPRAVAPAIEPAAPLDPALQLSPEELTAWAAAPPPPPSRRFVLGTAALVVLGAGAGVGWSFWRTRSPRKRTAPPALLAAARDERALVAVVDAHIAAHPEARDLLRQLRADHVEHADTLDAAIKDHVGHLPAQVAARPPAQGVTLLAVEQQAAARAAGRAAQLSGRDAALLASIAACESTHVALLK